MLVGILKIYNERLLKINGIIRQAENGEVTWKQAIYNIKVIMPCDSQINQRL